MKKNKKNILLKVLTGVSATCLIVAGVSVYVSSNNSLSTNSNTNDNYDDNCEIIKKEGIEIKFLKEVTNDDGSVTKTFTYEVTPSNATNQDVNVSFKYETGEECSDVISYEKNVETKEISVTCHKDFNTKIILTLTAVSNPEAYVEMSIHYEKKLLYIYINHEDLAYGDQFVKFDQTLLYKPVYSLFTKDKHYTYKIDIIDFTYDSGLGQWDYLEDKFSSEIISMVENETEWTAETWWNLDNSNEWHSALLEFSNPSYVYGDLDFNVYCVETGQRLDDLTCTINIPLAMDYSGYEVIVDSLQTSDIELVF